ncbi:hypothetical protein HanRHA438_Chr16g0786371 [Helianthus annuus]|nr:hypothetical protein HanIR_Chr16g0842181 [Helianthus annuus]KAJ0838196.1 hypothetical protein HanRHA438_Chr16g0786371 [Helianthus annuus]
MQTVRRVNSYSCSYFKKSNFTFKIPINFGEQRSTDHLNGSYSCFYLKSQILYSKFLQQWSTGPLDPYGFHS